MERPVEVLFRRLTTVFTCLLIFIFIATIPKLPGSPASPKYFLIMALFSLILVQNKDRLAAGFKNFPLIVMCYFIVAAVSSLARSSPNGVVAAGEGLMMYVIVFGVMISGYNQARFITRYTALLLVVSALWMIASSFIEEPFQSIRQFVYSGHMERFDLAYIQMANKTGLTFSHFSMGYQLAGGIILTVFLFLTEQGRWKIFWAISSGAMCIAILIASQRSVIPAVAFVLILYWFLNKKRSIKYIFLIGAVFAVIFFAGKYYLDRYQFADTIYSKFETQEDTRHRLGWQQVAMRIIAEKPVGNFFGELDWEDESLARGADYSEFGGEVKYVHNGYLAVMLSLGWAGVILVAGTLWYFIKNIFKPSLAQGETNPYLPFAALTSLALISDFIQAMFHNSSIFSLEPTTWILFTLAGGWVYLMRRAEPLREKI